MHSTRDNQTSPVVKMSGCDSELCVYESVGIGAGVVAFAVFIALLSYILHLRERRKKDKLATEQLNAMRDADGNDYASLRRMHISSQTPQIGESARENTHSIPSVSEEVYAEINESQMVGVRDPHTSRLPLPEFLAQTSDLARHSGSTYYLTPTSDTLRNGFHSSNPGINYYLTTTYTQSEPTVPSSNLSYGDDFTA